MRNIIFLVLSIFMLVSIHSCKDKSEPEPVQAIDSTLLKPEIKFTYELLDSGRIKFTNLSKYAASFKWFADYMRSKEKNPEFRFQKNGVYDFLLKALKENGVYTDSLFTVTISSINYEPEYATLNGIVFDREYDLKGPAIPRNSFSGGGILSLPRYTPGSFFSSDGFIYKIYIADFFEEQGTTYETMKNNFKVGKQPLAILRSYPTGDYNLKEHGWYILVGGQRDNYAVGRSPSDSLEILEIEEVYQPKLWPEMENKALWVTWHIKADGGGLGKIDCVLRMKYVFYIVYYDF